MARIVRGPAENDMLVLKALKKRPMTADEVAAAIKMGASTTGTSIARLRARKEIHIGGWDATGRTGKAAPVHFHGKGEDMPYPIGIGGKPRVRVRKPAAPKLVDDESACWKPRRICNHPVYIKRDWAVAALFGEYQGAGA